MLDCTCYQAYTGIPALPCPMHGAIYGLCRDRLDPLPAGGMTGDEPIPLDEARLKMRPRPVMHLTGDIRADLPILAARIEKAAVTAEYALGYTAGVEAALRLIGAQ